MDEIKTILCPVDFSEATPFGVVAAESLARHYGARITLLHVLPRLAAPFRVPVDPDDVYDHWQSEAGERLAEMAAESRLRGAMVATRMASGSAYQHVGAVARELCADLIVMPTHSRAGLDRLLYGSVAERVVRLSPCPVLTVPPALEGMATFAPRRLLVATDFSDEAEVAVAAAFGLARSYSSDVIIGHVFTFEQVRHEGAEWWRPTFTREQVEKAVEEATRRLDRLAARAVREGVKASTDLSQGASPAREIVRLAREEEVDLVVVASHGPGMLKHMFLGSTAEKLVRTCPYPLLTVPVANDELGGATLPDVVPAGC